MTSVNGHPGESIATLLEGAIRRFVEAMTEAVGPGHAGLRASHIRLLNLIPDGGDRVTDLAERARMTKQALGQFVDNLQERGYVESARNPADGRVRIVRRTAKGDEVRDATVAAIERLEETWRAELGDRRYATMRNALRDLGQTTV